MRRAHILLCFFGVVLSHCSRHEREASQESKALSASGAREIPLSERVLPYKYARWRLAPRIDLSRVVVWLSHILVRHRDIVGSEVPLSSADWQLGGPAPTRSREEALVLAQHVAALARSEPGKFAQLAREYSEDATTREVGGALGGMRALELSLWPRVLDTAAALGPGEVSEVMESLDGFHVFLRAAPPEEERVSGARIVIGHDEAPWLHQFLARGPVPHRSHAEALVLAQRVYAEAAANPERFAELVQKYSDHVDALQGGDIGEWSNREPSPYPRELDALARVKVGEVTPPRETLAGLQILLRTPSRPRELYAAQVVRFNFDPEAAPSSPQSKAGITTTARSVLERLRGSPNEIVDYQRQYCCERSITWREGRAEPRLGHAVASIGIGEVASELVDEHFGFAIVRRVPAPPEQPGPEISFDLPNPEAPDLGGIIGQEVDSETFLAELLEVGQKVSAVLQLPEQKVEALRRVHDLSEAFADASVRPQHAVEKLLNGARELLGDVDYPRYRAILYAHFEELVLHPELRR